MIDRRDTAPRLSARVVRNTAGAAECRRGAESQIAHRWCRAQRTAISHFWSNIFLLHYESRPPWERPFDGTRNKAPTHLHAPGGL